jgi:lipopolysaccharide/colanic/teichoic acid biosynthesis glycosyltransferase
MTYSTSTAIPVNGVKMHEAQYSRESEVVESTPVRVNGFADHHARDVEARPQMRRTVEPQRTWYLPIKRVLDLVGSIVLLALLWPFILVGAVLVKITSRGPAFYRQVRVGKDGVDFMLYKLRTMRHNAEAETGPVWSTQFDSRVTWLGKFLRASHIDEFPQLWNVIRGDMSLVGPRPERPEFVAKLDWEVPFYRERLRVRPGITGLAQLRLPPDTTIECVRKKVEHDVFYVKHINPWLDSKLMIFTAWRLVKEVIHCAWKAVVLPTDEDIDLGFRQSLGMVDEKLGVARFPAPRTLQQGSPADAQNAPEFVK